METKSSTTNRISQDFAERCRVCGAAATAACGSCNNPDVAYCGAVCQHLDWFEFGHDKECSGMNKTVPTSGTALNGNLSLMKVMDVYKLLGRSLAQILCNGVATLVLNPKYYYTHQIPPPPVPSQLAIPTRRGLVLVMDINNPQSVERVIHHLSKNMYENAHCVMCITRGMNTTLSVAFATEVPIWKRVVGNTPVLKLVSSDVKRVFGKRVALASEKVPIYVVAKRQCSSDGIQYTSTDGTCTLFATENGLVICAPPHDAPRFPKDLVDALDQNISTYLKDVFTIMNNRWNREVEVILHRARHTTAHWTDFDFPDAIYPMLLPEQSFVHRFSNVYTEDVLKETFARLRGIPVYEAACQDAVSYPAHPMVYATDRGVLLVASGLALDDTMLIDTLHANAEHIVSAVKHATESNKIMSDRMHEISSAYGAMIPLGGQWGRAIGLGKEKEGQLMQPLSENVLCHSIGHIAGMVFTTAKVPVYVMEKDTMTISMSSDGHFLPTDYGLVLVVPVSGSSDPLSFHRQVMQCSDGAVCHALVARTLLLMQYQDKLSLDSLQPPIPIPRWSQHATLHPLPPTVHTMPQQQQQQQQWVSPAMTTNITNQQCTMILKTIDAQKDNNAHLTRVETLTVLEHAAYAVENGTVNPIVTSVYIRPKRTHVARTLWIVPGVHEDTMVSYYRRTVPPQPYYPTTTPQHRLTSHHLWALGKKYADGWTNPLDGTQTFRAWHEKYTKEHDNHVLSGLTDTFLAWFYVNDAMFKLDFDEVIYPIGEGPASASTRFHSGWLIDVPGVNPKLSDTVLAVRYGCTTSWDLVKKYTAMDMQQRKLSLERLSVIFPDSNHGECLKSIMAFIVLAARASCIKHVETTTHLTKK